jgi:rRNA-processing protein EBP2
VCFCLAAGINWVAKKKTATAGTLDRVLASFELPKETSFFETQTLTYPEDLEIPDVSDDLKRELELYVTFPNKIGTIMLTIVFFSFLPILLHTKNCSYKQSLWAAQEAHRRFAAASKPFTRPSDYFAEMVKSDDHMERVRQKLLDESASLKASEEAKRQRQLKKFGKKVQVAKQLERQKEKKALEEKVKAFKKSNCLFFLFLIPEMLNTDLGNRAKGFGQHRWCGRGV